MNDWFRPTEAAREWLAAVHEVVGNRSISEFLKPPGVGEAEVARQLVKGELLNRLHKVGVKYRMSTPHRYRVFMREVARLDRERTRLGRLANRILRVFEWLGLYSTKLPEDI